jgi:hypothetical protein
MKIDTREVLVSFNSMKYILERHALPTHLGSNIAPAEHLIATALSERKDENSEDE